MGLAFKIAWRNLWRHRGKSLVIGGILLIGALLMTLGNGVISGMEKGMSDNIVNLFTGDIVVISNEQEKDDVIFEMMGKPVKVIKNFKSIQKIMDQDPSIQRYLPATVGFVLVFNSGTEMGHTMLLGVDIDKYKKMFPGSYIVTAGRDLNPGERGILVSEESQKQSYDEMGFWLLPEGARINKANLPAEVRKFANSIEIRHDLVIMGTSESNTAMDIRVPIKGLIKYKSLNKIWGNYCIIDINSFREAHNYLSGEDKKVKLSTEEKKIMSSNNLDDMFSQDNMVESNQVTSETISESELKKQVERKDTVLRTNAGSYNVVFIKVKNGVSKDQALQRLNKLFKAKKINARAVSWREAVGTIGSMAVLIKGALNIFIMFIFFVAIIIIMNTLSMAALERTAEIGMMRAIGARKGFLRNMFVCETGLLSFFFGGLGILLGTILIFIIQAFHITTTNEILQLVYGGDQLSPIWTVADFALGFFELACVTSIANAS